MTEPGLEIVIEPDVLPRGTVDLRALDAPPGAEAPPVRVTRTGLVVPLGTTSRPDLSPASPRSARGAPIAAPGPESAPAGPETGGDGADAAVAALEAVYEGHQARAGGERDITPEPVTGEDSDHEVRLLPALVEPEAPSGSRVPGLAALDAAASAPIPPRPEAAGEGKLGGAAVDGAAWDEDPEQFDTALVGGGYNPVWEVTKVISWFLFLIVGLMLLVMGLVPGMWPFGQSPHVAAIDPAGDPGEDAGAREDGLEVRPLRPDDAGSVQPVATEPATPDGEGGAPTAATDDSPAADAATDPAGSSQVTELQPPATSVEVEPEQDPTPDVEALRALAAQAETGGELGVEEDTPGILGRIEQLRSRALERLDAGDLAGAQADLEELLRHKPQDADALFRLGVVLERTGDLAGARTRYLAASEQAPTDPRPWNNLALLQLAAGERDEGEASLQRALELGPENPDVLTNLANLTAERRPEQAHPLYDKALTRDPKHGPARLGRGLVRERLGDAPGAETDYRFLVEAESPLKPRALDGLGRLARLAGRYEEAVDLHRQALDGGVTEAQVNLGVALLDLGRAADARTTLEEAVRRLPGSAKGWQALGVSCARLSASQPQLLAEAKRAYEEAIKLEPGDWLTRFNYALCAERSGNFPVAMQQYEITIRLAPQAWRAYANLARLYEQGGSADRALAFIDRALQAAPREPDLHLHRAYLLARQDRRFEARAALRRFIELAPAGDPRLQEIQEGLDGEGRG